MQLPNQEPQEAASLLPPPPPSCLLPLPPGDTPPPGGNLAHLPSVSSMCVWDWASSSSNVTDAPKSGISFLHLYQVGSSIWGGGGQQGGGVGTVSSSSVHGKKSGQHLWQMVAATAAGCGSGMSFLHLDQVGSNICLCKMPHEPEKKDAP